jgi:hypothetical protein
MFMYTLSILQKNAVLRILVQISGGKNNFGTPIYQQFTFLDGEPYINVAKKY